MGRGDEVAAIAERGRTRDDQAEGLLRYLMAFGEIRALVVTGDFAIAEQRSADIVRVSSPGQYLAWGMANVLAGTVELARGQFPATVSRMEQTVAALTSESAASWSFAARLPLAQAYSVLGRTEPGSKMIADEDRAEQRLGLVHMLRDELARDRYGIAWTVMPQAKGIAGIKPIALAPRQGGAYVLPARETFQDRTYPLVRSIHIFLNRAPGRPLEPRLREFLRFILSREGQDIVDRDGGYLPLTAAVALEQLKKLD